LTSFGDWIKEGAQGAAAQIVSRAADYLDVKKIRYSLTLVVYEEDGEFTPRHKDQQLLFRTTLVSRKDGQPSDQRAVIVGLGLTDLFEENPASVNPMETCGVRHALAVLFPEDDEIDLPASSPCPSKRVFSFSSGKP